MISQDEYMKLMFADRQRSDWNLLSNRETYFGPNGQTYFVLRNVIEFALTAEPYPLWKRGNHEDRQKEDMIALDIGSGPAIWTLALGEYFSNTRWIATELEETLEIETKSTLNFLSKDYHMPLFEDCNGNVIYIGDSISLQGLTNQNFNRKMGILVKKDSQHEGRYAICLCSGKVISIKSANIVKMNSHMGLDETRLVSMEKALQDSQKRKILIEQMLKDTRLLDVTLDSSILASKDLFGKCGLVTCTNLLRMVKHRHPNIWQDVLYVASLMLKENGILFTYDATIGNQGYGNFQEMHQYAHRHGLKLVHFGMPSPNDNTPAIPMSLKRDLEALPGSRTMALCIWRKWYTY
ncbi:predicted protein [Chaetoceros tenuissimus]|uniref:Uncharacterized protein n=1 Tax=Chaetoceros tenuissimus TaxID=426638 RepID=A0AAD3DCH9_9STRA|nr:predicted protein [Chaetoceros tenuissimus]